MLICRNIRKCIIQRVWQIILIVCLLANSWLGMQAIHECGHVITAYATGGQVAKVVLHPLVISRTDLAENPHPLAVVWGGPLFGSLIPLMIYLLVAAVRFRAAYLFRFFAGFCLVANGAYIGTGQWLADEADPKVMLERGSSTWMLVGFGIIATAAGLLLWHRQGGSFGLGPNKKAIRALDAVALASLLFLIVATECLINSR
jgi:hypothetical protein